MEAVLAAKRHCARAAGPAGQWEGGDRAVAITGQM